MLKNNKNMLKKTLWVLVWISISFTAFASYPELTDDFIESPYSMKSLSKSPFFPTDLQNNFTKNYSKIILEIEKFWKMKSKEKSSLKELEKKKKELENEYKKNYKKLKNKKWIKSLEEIKKVFSEYIEFKKISQIKWKSYIREDYNKEDRKFFTRTFKYKIDKEHLKQADNIYLISWNYNIPFPKIRYLNFSNFTNKIDIKDILGKKWFSLIKNIEKSEWTFSIKRFDEKNNSNLEYLLEEVREVKSMRDIDNSVYYIILEKGDNTVILTSRNIFISDGFPFSDDKKEFNKAKERFFNNFARNNYQKRDFYLSRFWNDKKLEDYMRLVLSKKIEKFETIEDKKEFLWKITKLLEKTLENTQTNVNNLMETFVSDDQIDEISKKYNKIIKNKELFIIFIWIIKEEEKILDFKTLEKIIF